MTIYCKLPLAWWVLFIGASTHCNAQTIIRGLITDSKGHGVEGATVLLLTAKDSSLVKGSVTSKSGTYAFEKVASGQYMINSSFTGLPDVYSQVFQIHDSDVFLKSLPFPEPANHLSAITVTTRKPLFEQKIDRMVINVASTITNAGSTVLEVLMRSPGISVNQLSSTLSMNGKEGVIVMLNGKVNRIPMEAMVQMLGGMSSSNIEKIELITSPPANFDAEGNAGFINIVLKKNTEFGTNGSISATIGYGLKAGPVEGSSINFNHRQKNWNLYGDYSFERSMPNTYGTLYRKIIRGPGVVENFMNTNRSDFRRNHNGRVGLDYDVNQNTIVGVLISGFSNMYGMKAINTSNIVSNSKLDTTIVTNNPESHPLDNYSFNFNVLHHFKKEQQLSVNADYIYFKDGNTLSYLNQFYKGDGSFIYADKVQSKKVTPIRFWVVTLDYSKKIGEHTEMESGIKTTYSHFINDVRVDREAQGHWIPDPEFSAKHTLDEKILGAYTSFNFKLGEKTTSKIGLRYEHTSSNLGSETEKNIVDKHYGELFPSIFLSQSLNDQHSFNISYIRRITRPTFNDMAPFVYFVDPNTLFSGNPALQPALANVFKWDFLLKQFVFSLSYTHEKNTITNFAPTIDPVSNKQILAAENEKDKNVAAFIVSLPFKIASWWSMQNSISAYWQQLHGIYKGQSLEITQRNAGINSTQSFLLPRQFSMEVSGDYQTGGLFGIYTIGSTTSLNFGVQKKLGDKGGTLSFNLSDFTGPPHLKISVVAPEYNLIVLGDWKFTVTTFKLTYRRKFGNTSIKGNRNRNTGSEDESQRVHAN